MRLHVWSLEKQLQQINPINIVDNTNMPEVKSFSSILSIIPEISDGRNEIARISENILIRDRGLTTGKSMYKYRSAAKSV